MSLLSGASRLVRTSGKVLAVLVDVEDVRSLTDRQVEEINHALVEYRGAVKAAADAVRIR